MSDIETVILRFEDKSILDVAYPATRGEHGYLEIAISAGTWRPPAHDRGEDYRQLIGDLESITGSEDSRELSDWATELLDRGWRR